MLFLHQEMAQLLYATFPAPANKQTNSVCYQLVNVVKELPAKK